MSSKLPEEQHFGRLTDRVIAGRYQIVRQIASGGMGVVYLAEHIDLGRHVALKILKHQTDPEHAAAFQERFTLEARTLANLDHPNIVTLYDYGRTDDGRFFLALEYIDGPRYTDLIRDGLMNPERAIRLLLQVCRALRYSHRRGVIHRDLKPSNLLTQRDDEGHEIVKVVDFGLVKVLEDDQSLTQAGLILGSPHCMAPEQVKGEGVDARADIYAMGVLLFRSLTGCWPFHGETSTATMIAHLNTPVPRFADRNPDVQVSESLEIITMRCLAKEPDDRFASVGDLMQALQLSIGVSPDEFASTSHMSVGTLVHPPVMEETTEQTRAPVAPRSNGLTSLAIVAVVALLLSVGAIAWMVGQMGRVEPVPTAPEQAATPSTAPAPPASVASSAPDAPSDVAGDADPIPEPIVVTPPVALEAVKVAPQPTTRPTPTARTVRTPNPKPPVQPKTEPDAVRDPVADPAPVVEETPETPAEPPAEEEQTPEGYMELPDDLFGEQ